MIFVRSQHIDELNELNTCELESQDATKITSASADTRINISWRMMSLLVRTLCLCLVLLTIFQCFTFSSQLCDHVIISTELCSQSKQVDTAW